MKIEISKSSYILGLRCPKALHHKFHKPNLIESESSSNFLMQVGLEFEETARDLIAPKGIDVTENFNELDFKSYIDKTRETLKKTNVNIYQATFKTKSGERVLTDIIRKKGKSIDLIEIKAVTSLSDYHYYDVAYQYYCIAQSGYSVDKIYIGHVNKEYVRSKSLSKDLVKLIDVTEKVKKIQSAIPEKLRYFKSLIKNNEVPDNNIGYHCVEPYDCQFKAHCWKQKLPENNIFDVRGLRIKDKINQFFAGRVSFSEILSASVRLTNSQSIQIRCALNNQEIFDREKIKNWLDIFKIENIIYFLDFEAIGLATPQFEFDKPYTAIPIQASIHKKINSSQELMHYEFLGDPTSKDDVRLKLIEMLTKILGRGNEPIIAYHKAYEAGRLRYLIRSYPEYEIELTNILNRLYDLADVFKEKWYYHPDFKGSYSIKYVLPILCPDLSYSSLDVKNGSQASSEYLRLKKTNNDLSIRKALLDYCKLDTFAMVKIMEALEKKVKTTKTKILWKNKKLIQ